MRVDVGDVRLFVEVVGTKLDAEAGGAARPTIVVLHGGPADVDHWFQRWSYDALADVAQLVYLDHRGAGQSDRSSKDHWNLETWGDDVLRLCDALELDRPFVLGSSFGAWVALSYASRHPEHPRGLILECASLGVDADKIEHAFERVGGVEPRQAFARLRTDRSEEALANFSRLCLPLYSRRGLDRSTFTITEPNRELAAFWGEQTRSIDFRGKLGSVRSPTLILAGEFDPIAPPESAQELLDELANARLEIVRGAAHAVARDASDTVLGLIREFVSMGEDTSRDSGRGHSA